MIVTPEIGRPIMLQDRINGPRSIPQHPFAAVFAFSLKLATASFKLNLVLQLASQQAFDCVPSAGHAGDRSIRSPEPLCSQTQLPKF
jgi:hypothetical protein